MVDYPGAPDATFPVLAKVSSQIEMLRLGSPYELVHQLWSQFMLTVSRMNIDVTWSRDKVLIGVFLFHVSTCPCALAYCGCVLVDHFKRDVHPFSYTRILSRVFGWVKAHGQCSIEFEERGSEICVMVRTWDSTTFRRVCVAVLSRFSANTTLEAIILGKILDAASSDASVVSLHGGPYVLAEAFEKYLGNGYRAKLVEFPTFDLQLLERCLQRTSASVSGNLDPFPMTEFVVNRLKGAETWNWMASCPALRKANITNELSMPGIVDVVLNIVGVWPIVVSYLKETDREDDGDSLVVTSSLVGVLFASFVCTHYWYAV